ncbi:MAG: endolytic transglycosylase MltG [Pseudomonadota bacterium]
MKKHLLRFLGLLIIAASLAVGFFWKDYEVFTLRHLVVNEQNKVFVVKPGSSVQRIANELFEQGIIIRPHYFAWAARWQNKAHRIQSGEYLLSNKMTALDLLDDMAEGKVMQHGLTVVEGWTFAQLRQALAQHPAIKHTLEGKSAAEVMSLLGHPGQHPEGRFYPDTYYFPRGLSDIDFLKRAYEVMDQQLNTYWEGRAAGLPYKTPYEALIMASIIEKETAVPAERPAIAGVFVRRLQKRMRLQTDPTVIYGLGEGYDGNLRRNDLTTDTPYNTYTRFGLPPTPIALPGGESIKAALHPDASDAVYFVARGDGTHAFSATLEQHNQAVVKYQLKGNKPR